MNFKFTTLALLATVAFTVPAFAAEMNPDPTTDATATAEDNVIINVDSDNGGAGTFQVIDNNAGSPVTVMNSDAQSTTIQTTGGTTSMGITTTTANLTAGNNGVVVNDTANTVTLTADSDATPGNGRSVITAGPTSASVLVTNGAGNTHGLTVGAASTTLSGGTTSTTLTLDDDGATFATDGGDTVVSGIADGVAATDAVNVRQLNAATAGLSDDVADLRSDMGEAEGGIAGVAAMANIPQVEPGKNFAVGAGYGNFKGENAMALGGSARFSENVVAKASVGFGSNSATTVGGGVAYSW